MKYLLTILLLISCAYGQTVCPPPPENIVPEKSLTAEVVDYFDSNPLAEEVIFYDFDGGRTTSIFWDNGNEIVYAESGMTNANATAALFRTKEDYWQFWVSVTNDSNRYNAAPADKRVKIAVTPTNYFRLGVGGVAYLGVFGANFPVAGWVFSGILGYTSKNVGEAMSHEAGHTFNLYHQSVYDSNCVKTQEYDPGRGFPIGEPGSDIGHAPIMGASYYRNNTTFTIGPDSRGCSNTVNEVDTIRNYLNFRPLSDSTILHGQTTIVNVNIPQLSVVTFRAKSFGNADIQMNIWNIPDSLSSSSIITLPAGNYQVNLSGAGNIWNRGIGSGGQVKLTALIDTVGIIPIRDDRFIYDRTRDAKVKYEVFEFGSGKRVKQGYSEISKALDGLKNGTYVVHPYLYYTIQIIKQ